MLGVIDLFTGFYMFFAWLLYLVGVWFFMRSIKGIEDAWFILGVLGAIFLIPLLTEYGIAWESGYIYEQIAASSRVRGYSPYFMVFEVLVGLIASMNVFTRFRGEIKLRKLQLIVILVYLLVCIIIYGYKPYGYATTIIPGWHTTVYQVGNLYGTLFWLLIIIALTLGLHVSMRWRSKE